MGCSLEHAVSCPAGESELSPVSVSVLDQADNLRRLVLPTDDSSVSSFASPFATLLCGSRREILRDRLSFPLHGLRISRYQGNVHHPCIRGRGITPLQYPSYQRPHQSQSLIPGDGTISRERIAARRGISMPISLDFHIRLIEPPASSHGMLAAAEGFLDLRRILEDPPIERGVINRHSPFLQHFFQLTVRNGIGDIPPDAPQDDFFLEMTPLKVPQAASPPPQNHVEERSGTPLK
jgi:hypothetical protein